MIIGLLVLYLALVGYAYFFSDSLMFQPHPASYRDGADILKVKTSSGKKISAVYLPNNSARYTLLVSHGNAEDLGDDHEWLQDLRREGFSVFAFDYQGYGTSEGKPSESALYEDEFAAYDYLAVPFYRRWTCHPRGGQTSGSGADFAKHFRFGFPGPDQDTAALL